MIDMIAAAIAAGTFWIANSENPTPSTGPNKAPAAVIRALPITQKHTQRWPVVADQKEQAKASDRSDDAHLGGCKASSYSPIPCLLRIRPID